MRRMCGFLVLVSVSLGWGMMAEGSMIGLEQLNIDFRKSKTSKSKFRWSPSKKVQRTAKGLGWVGDARSSWDGWILSAPLAVGISWRPARSVNLQVSMSPAPQPVKLPNGQTYSPYAGRVFARFSPDQKYWSTWQPLTMFAPTVTAKGKSAEIIYRGELGVPGRATRRYQKLLGAYVRRTDVPWRSDEEALVREIIKREPHFFKTEKPFVGYVQVLWEGSFRGGQYLKSLNIRAVFAVSGFHYPPKKKSRHYSHQGPWRFVHPSIRP